MDVDFELEGFDDLDYEDEAIQRKYRQLGFKRGYSLGEETGWREGYAYGVKKGATIAAEIGFYQGFVYAWINLLEKEDTHKKKKVTVLRDLLNMTKEFPKTNVGSNEEKLSRIRAKFKQINSLLNLDISAENFDFTTSAPASSSKQTNQSNFSNSQTTCTPSNQKGNHNQKSAPRQSFNQRQAHQSSNVQEMSF